MHKEKDKVRLYVLARELGVETKDLIALCQQHGIDVKNQLSSLDHEQQERISALLKQGSSKAAPPEPTKPSTPLVLPEVSQKVPTLHTARPARPTTPRRESPAPAATEPPAPVHEAAPEVESPVEVEEPAAAEPPVREEPAAPAAAEPSPPAAPAKPTAPEPAHRPAPPPARTPEQQHGPAPVAARSQEPPRPVAPPSLDTGSRVPDLGSRPPAVGRPPDLNQPRSPGVPRPKRPAPKPTIVRVAPPPQLKIKPPEQPKQQPVAQKPIARPDELAARSGPAPATTSDATRGRPPVGPVAPPQVTEEDEDSPRGKARSHGVPGRDQRQQKRNQRAADRKGRENEPVVRLDLDDDRPTRYRSRGKPRVRNPITAPRKDNKVPIALPITVRSLSEAIGMRSVELLFKLRDYGAPPTININSTLDPEMALTVALDKGVELDIKRPIDAEEELLKQMQTPDEAEQLVPRAPIVTIMGHVDHGKTSLLDKIRASNVVDTEAGGITQVIRAWRVEHGGRPITFLDTPGHEAFTKMRARGANVTDIAVIVVAADDGIMPQTEEAINHAKAAGVSIVVAINKIDLPNANIKRTEQQLYGHQLIPDTMGGDTPFVYTSAATGKGIPELLDMLSLVAELKELKANPDRPGTGLCLEAMLSEGEGVQATLLVQNGTLRRGDVILCGASFGRVRAMYDDLGRPIQEAGPSVPVRITGLDEVPDADDSFQVAEDLSVARDIAERRESRNQEAALVRQQPAFSGLALLNAAKITELKVILKADFRGSVEAIRKELEKLQHEEVRVRVLLSGIGAITENDVNLAMTSPQDTLIVGFNVVPDDRARSLAEERGIPIRLHNIIYELTDDIKSALEGKLKPKEEVVHLGRAVVRQTFKVGKVGTVAGCYVTQGTIERSAKVRLIREGVVIYPPAERTAGLDSLKRFKDDVKEVREGFECGIKILGYDDIKVGDVIEAYRIEQIQRTL